MLEEVLQGLADGVPFLNGQQVLQLLSEGAAVNPYTGRQDLRHPLQGAEHWGAGTFRGNASPYEVRLRKGEAGRTVLHYQSGHGTAALEHGHHLLMGGGPADRQTEGTILGPCGKLYIKIIFSFLSKTNVLQLTNPFFYWG